MEFLQRTIDRNEVERLKLKTSNMCFVARLTPRTYSYNAGYEGVMICGIAARNNGKNLAAIFYVKLVQNG